MTTCVAYYRVSTQRQEHGIDAQRMDVQRYAQSIGAQIVAEFSEKESGRNNQRPELQAAIQTASRGKHMLLIAKLDRLSRNALFLHDLKERLTRAGVNVVAVDMPEVLSNTLMLAVMAGMAQHERELIAKRTREGLAAAKAKGKRIGREKGCDTSKARQLAAAARQQKAREQNTIAASLAASLHNAGQTLCQIAEALNASGLTTARGKAFRATSVSRLLKST